jgi:hypothetical protein
VFSTLILFISNEPFHTVLLDSAQIVESGSLRIDGSVILVQYLVSREDGRIVLHEDLQ